jgi:RNA polymerase sigma-70 factor (ECF subfamily)
MERTRITTVRMSDRVLRDRLLAGDDIAFGEFFADYFPRLYRFALVRLDGDADAAEDVVQASLIRAIDKMQTYRGEAAMFTWLCALCRREVAAWHSRQGRRGEVPLIDDRPDVRAALDALAAAAGDPAAEVDRSELARLVQATLDHLPRRYGDALEWRYVEGLSVPEIGVRLGLGYKATESLLSRARQAFREGFTLVTSGGARPVPGTS